MKHLIDKSYISTVDAAKKAGVSKPTIIQWCKNLGIGKKIAGTWHVNEKLLTRVLAGEIYYEKNKNQK